MLNIIEKAGILVDQFLQSLPVKSHHYLVTDGDGGNRQSPGLLHHLFPGTFVISYILLFKRYALL